LVGIVDKLVERKNAHNVLETDLSVPLYLTIYLSIYLSTYLPTYLSIYGSTPFARRKAVTCKQDSTNRIKTHRHPCLEWDSNP
jgi:hypothetical protein